jgi:hypothetical protein
MKRVVLLPRRVRVAARSSITMSLLGHLRNSPKIRAQPLNSSDLLEAVAAYTAFAVEGWVLTNSPAHQPQPRAHCGRRPTAKTVCAASPTCWVKEGRLPKSATRFRGRRQPLQSRTPRKLNGNINDGETKKRRRREGTPHASLYMSRWALFGLKYLR